ncbi:MAG: hypothetical protein LAO09_02935 [Acidobacteriia bacterium]|nr:hypothetical protein [Terriglobia bacterium]
MKTASISEPVKTGPPEAKVRDARFEDYEQIAALQERNGLASKPREEWEHLWTHNPEYRKVPNLPIGFVIEDAKGEVVGYTALIQLSYQFEGREVSATSGWGMAVDPPYRGLTNALIRRVVSPEASEFQVDASAKPNVARILDVVLVRRKVGGRIPAGDWDNASFWITNYRGFLRSAIKAKGLPGMLSYPAAGAMWLRDSLRGANSWAKRGQGHVEPCNGFDGRFDQFWEELKRAYPNRYLATRSREVLQWHFHYALAANKLWILTVGHGSRILAYSVFRRQDNPQLNLTRVRLIDFQVINGDNQLLVPMLAWALRKCQQEGIHMLEAYGFRSDKQNVIESLAPHRRPLPAWCFFYATHNKALKQKLENPDVWDPSHFDGDESL